MIYYKIIVFIKTGKTMTKSNNLRIKRERVLNTKTYTYEWISLDGKLSITSITY